MFNNLFFMFYIMIVSDNEDKICFWLESYLYIRYL